MESESKEHVQPDEVDAMALEFLRVARKMIFLKAGAGGGWMLTR